MSKATKGMNRHQKRAFRKGEGRVRGEEIQYYLELSRSEDPEERFEAARHLCPCRVRRRIDEVWEALYRMLEDPDEGVRTAAYHTLEDGGRPDDPRLREIFANAWETETNRTVRGFLKLFLGNTRERQEFEQNVKAAVPAYPERGKCDFCGETDVAVRKDFDTEVPAEGGKRFALMCEDCDA